MNGTQKHTAGPWKASANPGRQPTNWFVEKPMQGEGRFYLHIVAEIPSHSTQAEADARLIAAAPDLFQALEECITNDGAPAWNDKMTAFRRLHAISDIARAALAKAKGEG